MFVAGSLQEEVCNLSTCGWSSGSLAQQRRLTFSKRHLKRRGAVLGNGMHTLEQVEWICGTARLHASPSFIVFCLRVGLALYKVRRLGCAAQAYKKALSVSCALCISLRMSVRSHEPALK